MIRWVFRAAWGKMRRLHFGLVELFGGVVSGILTAAFTLGIVVTAVLVGGIVMVSRGRHRPERELDSQRTRAGVALVQADDALQSAERELGFALAQFGERDTAAFRVAIDEAEQDRREIFRLHGMLVDDPAPGLRQRERADRIVMLADRITARLGEHEATFRRRRSAESGARERLTRLRERSDAVRARHADDERARQHTPDAYSARALGAAADAPRLAAERLDAADAALARVDDALAQAVPPPVTEELDNADVAIAAAERLLDDRAAAAARLDDVATALESLAADARVQRTEALDAVGSAPDPDTAAGITRAVADVDAALASTVDARDPLPALTRLRAALDALDVALAAARTQAQRLSHAREALDAAMVTARIQLADA
ncbi:MAG: hypothetical protein ACK4SC_10170, partial [Microcella sp.]